MAYTRQPNKTFAGRALTQFPAPQPLDPAGEIPVTLNANIASKFGLGVVQIGDNINVTADGVISVATPSGNCDCITKTVDSNYTIQETDYYIGVNSDKAVTIMLPAIDTNCSKFVVKAQMAPPLGNRKVTIVPQGVSTIDGQASYVLSVPYESVTLISNDGQWWII